MKRMILCAALVIGLAFSAFGQTEPNSVPKKVNVVIINGSGDTNNDAQILAAFQKALIDAGFVLGDTSSPYTLEVSFTLEEDGERAGFMFFRAIITAHFIDTTTRQTVIPIYTLNNRDGHTTLDSAKNRTIVNTAQIINEQYKSFLGDNFPGN